MNRRTTIVDVASEAGVSKATVSRYFNHRERLLSPDIAARVEAAVTKLGYSPSPMAQALSHGRSRLIGLVVADISNPYSVAVLRGAEKVCQEAGYLLMLFNLGNDPLRERAAVEAMASYQVDGLILNTQGQGDGKIDLAVLQGIPAVLVDRRHAGLHADFVSLDNPHAIRSVCDHLVSQGWRDLLYLTQPMSNVSSRLERADAFRHCTQLLGPAVHGTVEELDSESTYAWVQLLRHWQTTWDETRPPAIVASNAVVTLRVAAAIDQLGWTFGHDVGFVGVDDPEWGPLIRPGLSAMAQPTDALGQCAAQCLIERLGGFQEAPRERLLQGSLIVRGSSLRPVAGLGA